MAKPDNRVCSKCRHWRENGAGYGSGPGDCVEVEVQFAGDCWRYPPKIHAIGVAMPKIDDGNYEEFLRHYARMNQVQPVTLGSDGCGEWESD